jgi:nicotinamide-nucleotide amidase
MLGIDVLYHFSVGDNETRIAKSIEKVLEDVDLIITTGGLGPTQDDTTKEVIARAFSDELVLNQTALEHIKTYFSTIDREMTDNNIKQAYLPESATPFYNTAGTAPGFVLSKLFKTNKTNQTKTIIALPGPPVEMKAMWEKSAVQYLREKVDASIYYKLVFVTGLGESMLETKLMPLIDKQEDPTIATYAKPGECVIRITSKQKSESDAKKRVLEMETRIEDIVGSYITRTMDMYEYNAIPLKETEISTSIFKTLFDLLTARGLRLSVAESCTGGWFSKLLIDIPGSSNVYDRGLIVYSNDAKVEALGVQESTLEKHGAVSEETAMEMAIGALENSKADVAISVTGISGPEGGCADKPIGLAYFGIASRLGRTRGYKNIVPDKGREANRHRTAVQMCGRLIEYLQ